MTIFNRKIDSFDYLLSFDPFMETVLGFGNFRFMSNARKHSVLSSGLEEEVEATYLGVRTN
ncbi:hypothetical protein U1Q18_009130 [Sarracenia purpurea var. burkii]